MNLLILSCGTRNKMVRIFKETFSQSRNECVVCVDCSSQAPALYEADKYYVIPRITSTDYLPTILKICKENSIRGILPLQEAEQIYITEHKEIFDRMGATVIASSLDVLQLCKDKCLLCNYLIRNGVPAVASFRGEEEVLGAVNAGNLKFPLFAKPNDGCGSDGICKIDFPDELLNVLRRNADDYVFQNFLTGTQYSVDGYVDMVSGRLVSYFVKEKLRMRAGEADKAISVKNEKIGLLVKSVVEKVQLRGPFDMDIFEQDGVYLILEINPRFGGGYPHAWHCGLNFPKYLKNNLHDRENQVVGADYEHGILMMKFADEICLKIEDFRA